MNSISSQATRKVDVSDFWEHEVTEKDSQAKNVGSSNLASAQCKLCTGHQPLQAFAPGTICIPNFILNSKILFHHCHGNLIFLRK